MIAEKPYHNKGCNCFECQDDYIQELQTKYLKANNVDHTGRTNHADVLPKPASYYLDSKLVARLPVTIYKLPDEKSAVVIKMPKGSSVGTIQSYVVRDGQVFWEVNWFSGKHAGWVKNVPGLFNTEIAEQTASGLEQQKTVDKSNAILNEKSTLDKVTQGVSDAVAGTADALGSFGSNLKWILIGVVILVVVFAALKFTK